MKILLLIDSLGAGGAQRQLVNLAIGLKKKGAMVTILTYHHDEHYKPLLETFDIELLCIEKISRFSLKILFGIMRAMKSGGYDLCCSFLFTPSFYLLVTKPFYPNLRRIVSERTCETLVSRFDRMVTRKLYYLGADAIVVNSFHQYELLLRKVRGLNTRIKHIPNGVNTVDFPLLAKKKNGEQLNILAIGKVSKLKNAEVIIKAIRILRDEWGLIVHCQWAGPLFEWVENQSEYYNYCSNLLASNGLDSNWTWLGKIESINKIFEQADLLVHPSHGEGFPNVICESLATGTPVIASNVYDHSKIIEEEANGFLFDPDSESELADKIYKYYQLSPSDKEALSAAARETALEKFSNQRMIDSFWKLFNEIV